MARRERQFVCQECGAVYRKWQGRCEACDGWNCIVEEAGGLERRPGGPEIAGGRPLPFATLRGGEAPVARVVTGMPELDRVLGGGIVHGSAILIGGDPGIGKSTLLLQVMAALATAGHPCTYISGEEAVAQIRMRGQRLGLSDAPLRLAAANSLRDILTSLRTENGERQVVAGGIPEIVVVDSIQTVYADGIEAAAGTVSQVRACAHELVRHAKSTGAAVWLVGHVTKEGQLAGPRVVEHMVDTVLYFEGDRGHQFRILRAVKNRFGATDEIAVFEMGDRGLAEVANPSSLFLADRDAPVSGACVFAGIEGTRPLLMELQALVAESPLGTPRRAVVGWDSARLAMILAVLETRCGMRFGASDIYLNVAGGLRVREPAADLAAAAALLSALTDQPLPQKMVAFGEVSLAGEIRPVSQMEARLKEAAKLGFTEALVPAGAADTRSAGAGMRLREARHLRDIVPMFAAEAA